MGKPWIGPELLWLFSYALVALCVKITGSPVKSMDGTWIGLSYTVPLLLVPLSFALYYLPVVERNWLLLRIWCSCLIGGNYVLDKILNAHTEQGPGIGTIYIMEMGLLIFVLVAGSVFVKIKF